MEDKKMETKYLLIITLVLGIALFTGATIYSANSIQTQSSASGSENVFVNQNQATVNAVCTGVSCPMPNTPTINAVCTGVSCPMPNSPTI